MEHISKELTKKFKNLINDNNDSKDDFINDINDNSSSKNKYALNREKFTPNTPEAQLAENIASSFNDLQNYAFYLSVVNRLGYTNAESFWKAHKEEEKEKRGTRYEFRYSKKYFAWKYKKHLY